MVEAGLAWVGPPADAIAAMGDKAAARRRAAAAGVPVLAGYDGEAQDDATLMAEAARVGLPLLVKPAAGGGGKGMHVVRDAADLPDALAAARREAARAFGDDRLILERLLEGPRHVEVQVLFDRHGHGVHLGERDCSAQRRHQKIVEESPGPAVDQALRDRMGEAALTVAAAVGYEGAGTVEFLLDDAGGFHFLEMNTRLQVEHPVTEAVTGRDLVADQLRIAAGEPLDIEQAQVRFAGHALEARLYAEDPAAGFLPATGRVVGLRWPDGVRIDTGIREGDEVMDRYDPLLAKLIVHGADRSAALAAMRARARGNAGAGRPHQPGLPALADRAAGHARRRDADRHHRPDGAACGARAGRRRLGRCGGRRRGGRAPARRRLGWWLARQRPGCRAAAPRPGGASHRSGRVSSRMPTGWPSTLRRAPCTSRSTASRWSSPSPPPRPWMRPCGMPPHMSEGHAALVAPMPGRVVAVRATAGASVEAHATVVVIEAMKMEHAVTTPIAGVVGNLVVREGDQVQRGDLLAEVVAGADLESAP